MEVCSATWARTSPTVDQAGKSEGVGAHAGGVLHTDRKLNEGEGVEPQAVAKRVGGGDLPASDVGDDVKDSVRVGHDPLLYSCGD